MEYSVWSHRPYERAKLIFTVAMVFYHSEERWAVCVCACVRVKGWDLGLGAFAVHNPVYVWYTSDIAINTFAFEFWLGLTADWLFVCSHLWMDRLWPLRKQACISQWWNKRSLGLHQSTPYPLSCFSLLIILLQFHLLVIAPISII